MQELKDIDYALARILLDSVVNKAGRLTYKEIAEQLSKKLGRKINAHYNLAVPLGNVSNLCFSMGLPLISATVIYSNATSAAAVGEGFYPMACELRPEYKSLTPEVAWKTELKRVLQCKNWDKLDAFLSKVEGRETPAIQKTPRVKDDPFYSWLSTTTTLAESSVYKYALAVDSISKEMIGYGVIDKSLREMNALDLDVFIPRILSDGRFIEKNTRGNNMYSNALKQFRYYAHSDLPELTTDEYSKFIESSKPKETERESVVLSRIGQGIFRKQLFEKYRGRCIITGIDHPYLLVASHIKPWAASDNVERLSVENGLLLSATYDRLFDNGLITFLSDGRLQISSLISPQNKSRLRIENGMQFDLGINGKMKSFLDYHRDILFVR